VLDRGEEDRLDRGLSGSAELWPEIGLVERELLAEEDRGHGACLHIGRGLEGETNAQRQYNCTRSRQIP
jgi:hypothetical protein